MDKYCHPTLYWEYNYLSIAGTMGFKLSHANKRGPWSLNIQTKHAYLCSYIMEKWESYKKVVQNFIKCMLITRKKWYLQG